MAKVMLLPPSEYEGEVGTAVAGRVVLMRRTQISSKDTPSGKGGSKKGLAGCTAKGPVDKCEVHVLGGPGMSDVVYLDAWGPDAGPLAALAVRGRLITIANPKVVEQRPKYSTSPLRYFLRVKGPLNVAGTRIQEMAEPVEPWSVIPKHHPFVDVRNLERVDDTATVCMLAVVVKQPGRVQRMSSYGAANVCNAVVRQHDTTIRCAFWRGSADQLAEFEEGACIAMYQVRVLKLAVGEWELRATESTSIEQCPAELKDRVATDTNLTQAPTQSLTRAFQGVDYDRTRAVPTCVGALVSLLVADAPRTMEGVWELHGVTVLGLSPVLEDESLVMTCCEVCKRQVGASKECTEHPTAPMVRRWIGRLSISDDTGIGEAMIYHEALEETDVLPNCDGAPLRSDQLLMVRRRMRNAPWSMRVVCKKNEGRQQNYWEIKKMAPLLTAEGVVATWTGRPVAEVLRGSTCPLAKCADVQYDEGLGVTTVGCREVTVVRVWLRVLAPEDGDEVGVPDPTATGLRVSRRVRCAADTADEQEYLLRQSGISSGVQWLMLAQPNSCWLVLASKKGVAPEFVASGFLNLSTAHEQTANEVLRATLDKARGSSVTMQPTDTPLKRRRLLDEAMPHHEQEGGRCFCDRRISPLT